MGSKRLILVIPLLVTHTVQYWIWGMLNMKFKLWMNSTKKEVFWKKGPRNIIFFPWCNIPSFSFTHSIYLSEQYALSVCCLLCWTDLIKLVHGPLGQSNKHPSLDICPDQPWRNWIYQSKGVAKVLLC